MNRVDVIGAGAFGTGLAIALSGQAKVTLWCRDAEHAEEMRRTRANERRLPGARLGEALHVTSDAAELTAGAALVAVPMQRLRSALDGLRPSAPRLIACCKGIEAGTGLGPTGVLSETAPGAVPAILTGPSFATDIARGLPTALTLACADDEAAADLQTLLSTNALRLYRTDDVAGAEAGGALKNVMAIACGACAGAGLGDSARAALMTRGYAEMVRFALSRGARAETPAGLSGLGDLALTCASGQSRNFVYGLGLAGGRRGTGGATVEGVHTARAVLERAGDLDLPITRAVVALAEGETDVPGAMDALLSRPLKEE